MMIARPLNLAAAQTVFALALTFTCAGLFAAGKTEADTALARYQQERAVCTAGQSNQARDICLREAAAAYAEARQNKLDNAAPEYGGNARKRCERLPAEDRDACLARMAGQGTTSGSVSGGGIYRENVTRETVLPNPEKPAAPAPVAPIK